MDRLTEMEAFATVVDQGGFTDAARKMGVSKSSVSKHVANLETRLGTRLLNRTTQRVNPTEMGLIYYDRARRILSDAADADAMVASFPKAPSGNLKISIDADFIAYPLAAMFNSFLLTYRDISLTVEMNADRVDLKLGEYDAAIRIGALQDNDLFQRKLGETTLCMVASPHYLADFGWPKKIDDLTAHKLLLYAPSSAASVWHIPASNRETRHIRSTGALNVNDSLSLLNAAISGLGIAYLPSYIYADALKDGRIVDVMPRLPKNRQGIYITYTPEQYLQPKLRALVEFVGQHLDAKSFDLL